MKKGKLVMNNEWFIYSLLIVGVAALIGIIFIPLAIIGLYIWSIKKFSKRL